MDFPIAELKRFFTEAYEHKNDYQQFMLVTDEKLYKDLKRNVLKIIEEIEAPREPEPVIAPTKSGGSGSFGYKGSNKSR
tara:strand:+ start:261 stop:497 length:237 start_codon:yes stop_codon:yes gene_type:complete